MSELMRPMSFPSLMDWIVEEYQQKGSVFGIRQDKFYRNESGSHLALFGDRLSSPLGPAAGPNSQLAQNIVAAYLAGCRFVELKTVQIMDGAEMQKCVPRPCINAEDECYNVEWSTELTVEEAFSEYVHAWVAMHVLMKEFNLGSSRDFAFNMSVGYDLEGIQSDKVNNFIEGLKDAAQTKAWQECHEYLKNNIHKFKRFKTDDLEAISSSVCTSITLSTLHGCPPEEIERISHYLLTEKKCHTYIKCNPTLLGYEFARKMMDDMGYAYVSFDDHHFKNDLQYSDAVPMLKRLRETAKANGLSFGVKLTNTFPVDNKTEALSGDEMYMSGRSLFPLSINLANRLAKEFNGDLPISYSGGADALNLEEILKTGIAPVTVATTILKPGGYERVNQLAKLAEPHLKGEFKGIDVKALETLAKNVLVNTPIEKNTGLMAAEKQAPNCPCLIVSKRHVKKGAAL